MTETQNRGIERGKRGCLHGMPSFLPSCLWGSERVALSTREQLVTEGVGVVGTFEHGQFQIRCHIMMWTVFFFFLFSLLELCLVETVCTDSVLGHESCMSDGLCHMQKDKWDPFHFNHLWLIIDCPQSTQYCNKEKLIYTTSKGSYFTNCLRKCVPKSLTRNKFEMRLHHYLSWRLLVSKDSFTFQASSLPLYKKKET